MHGTSITDAIRAALASCISAARAEGYTGTDREYEYAPSDMEYVITRVGFRPTRAEWEDAGLRYIGSAHYDR